MIFGPNRPMPKNKKYVVALVTAPSLVVARRLARSVLHARLASCANLMPRVESHYWWEGKLESSEEVLILFKTEQGRAAALRDLVLSEHPYDTPEYITLPIETGSASYLRWISDNLTAAENS